MSGLARYVFRQVAWAVVLVTLGLGCAIWLTQSLQYIDYIINRGLSLGTFLYFTLLLMPSLLAVVLPIALCIAVLFIYHRMTIDRELVVMRSAGLSSLSLGAPALWLAGLVMLIGYAFSLYFLPQTFRTFRDMQNDLRNDIASVILQEGTFNTLSDDLTVYVRAREPTGELRGIMAQDDRNKEKPVTYMAERGFMVSSPAGPRVILVKGNRQEMETATGKLSLLYFDRYSVDLSMFSNDRGPTWREPSERFLGELFWPGDSDADRYYANKLKAEGHQRIATPLLAMTFTLIALAGLLSGEFNRRGQTKRLLMTVGCIAAVQAAAFGFLNLTAKNPAFTPLVYLNVFLPAIAASYVLLLDPRRRRPRHDPEDSAGIGVQATA